MGSQIIGFTDWFRTPPGEYLLAWERERFDQAVADMFGYHALQLGLPELDALRSNRMPHKWLALPGVDDMTLAAAAAASSASSPHATITGAASSPRVALLTDPAALPFPENSLDLVLLPHTLELARDPHDTLREVERVLVPEGRVVIAGFNPASLWGLRQHAGHLRQRLGGTRPLYLPSAGEFLAFRRVRDWLRLLGFEVERGRFGCWRPPLRSESGMARFAWMESAGARGWPVLGAVYMVEAVKRVRGMRLVGLARRERVGKRASAPVVVANRNPLAAQAGARVHRQIEDTQEQD